jgi:LPS export ABC transporter permease LptG
MRLLDRYLLRELLAPFAYCLGGFLMFWISSDMFKEMGEFQKARMNLADIAEYYFVVSPEFISIVLPVALLLALLYALTQHARHHEITAMRAAGIGLWRLALPYLVVGFFSSVALFVINEAWAPDAEVRGEFIKARHVQKDGVKTDPRLVQGFGFVNARDGRIWEMNVLNVETMEMTLPIVISKEKDGTTLELRATRAVRNNGVWTFHQVREFRGDPGSKTAPVPTIQADVMPRPDFNETPDEIRSEVRIKARMDAKNRHSKKDLPLSEIQDYLAIHPNISAKDEMWLDTMMHSRIAGPWKCLVVVLIALPFGAASGRRNVFAGVAGSIVICFAYFVLAEISLAGGTAGTIPPWIAGWLPNIAFTLLAVWLTRRVR